MGSECGHPDCHQPLSTLHSAHASIGRKHACLQRIEGRQGACIAPLRRYLLQLRLPVISVMPLTRAGMWNSVWLERMVDVLPLLGGQSESVEGCWL